MRTRENHNRGVIFDVDGTLVDSEKISIQTWLDIFAAAPRPATPADVHAVTGMKLCDGAARLMALAGVAGDPVAVGKRKEALYMQRARGNLMPFPDVVPFLTRLQAAHIPLAVASSGDHEKLALGLDETRLRAYFAAIVSADDVAHGKPAPDMFLRAAQLLGVAPARCVLFEDAPSGVAGGKAAGMRVVAVTRTFAAEQLTGADLVVDDFAAPGLWEFVCG